MTEQLPMMPGPILDSFAATRESLHQLAYFCLSPARYRFEERMGLKPTHNGFGTPQLGGRVLRVEDDLLVAEGPEGVATRTITTVADAADFCGITYRTDWFVGFGDPLDPFPPEVQLRIDVASVRLIGDLFALGERVLRRLGDSIPEEITEIQLWPEHFDLATEAGDEQSGRRASYGISPGDHSHPDPYFYVSAWGEIDRSDHYWNDHAFNGASLDYADLAGVTDPETAALEFLVEGFRVLH
jgi:hypothetical protein